MSFEEKGVWTMGVIAVVGYSVYLALILGGGGGQPLTEVAYQWPMLGTIGGAILAGIVVMIVVGILSPRDRDKKDQRDRDIYRFGEYVGNSFVVIGALGALVLALLEADHFWIANLLYLGFVLSAILGTVSKLIAYRRGLPSW